MKHSEFRAAMQDIFGAYAASLAEDLVLAPLGSRTANQALADGESPGRVWAAICEVNELPESVRWHHRQAQHKR
ncbi:DUF3046 domain-containing protein [Ruania alba]|uniref:DUF3046 domain-containing protein n=1 Tax=Ruania alba TaxID=648782 RepID=A0A1H5E5Q4_9MICO|nr:DUF3046 domain-containing protein [Ruania alba]SED86442.1 Protein of unknown function [Ruania alba]